MDFEQRIFQFIGKHRLIAPRGIVIIGVSGGADSMALLHALVGLRHQLGVQLYAAHFNHRFRAESQRDERFVAEACRRMRIPLKVGRRAGGRIGKLSEDDARQMRFKFFIKTANALNAQSVALAHTRNDLAETVLMRLIRGSGLFGLRAIMPCRQIEGVSFIRPILGSNRADVEAYLKTKKASYCTDATNLATMYERNRVRLELLPLLADQYNPRIIDVLADLAVTAGDDYEFISGYAEMQFKISVSVSKTRVSLDLKKSRRQHPAIRRLILRQMVESLPQGSTTLSFEQIACLEVLIGSDSEGQISLAQGLKAVKGLKSLDFYYA